DRHDFEKLAPNVRQARSFLDRTVLIERVKTCKRVRLQNAFELSEMLLRMLALAVRRISKPDSRRSLVACRTVVANISPEAAGLGLARPRRHHRHRSVVAMKLVRVEHIAAQNFCNGVKKRCSFANPAGQHGTVQCDAFARE